MVELTLRDICSAVLTIASAVVLLSNATKAIAQAVAAAKGPNAAQDKRLDRLEGDMKEVKQKLSKDYEHLEALDEGTRVTQRALLALLSHGIDGNNIKQMEEAKDALQSHLINR